MKNLVRYSTGLYLRHIVLLVALLCSSMAVMAQFPQPPGTPNALLQDTSLNKTNTDDWDTEDARVYYRYRGSDKVFTPDTSIHTFHRRPFSQPWYRDLGNLGTPARNMLFTPEYRVGPTLGYHVFDVYRYDIDSMRYYNTNRPFSYFNFRLGSKLEQAAEIMHTQNIKPNWNFSFQYRKINSPGFYQVQRANHDNANFTTYYQSRNLHYELYGALVYNKQQQDENGGITSDSLLLDSNYNERRTIPVNFPVINGNTSVPRAAIINMQRDYTIMVQHGYTFGRTDTLYNEDSTRFSLQITPRFGISHKFELTSAKHRYKDLQPDSFRYLGLFNKGFLQTDSVFSQQHWHKVDNSLMLNSYIGKRSRQLNFNAGLGTRYDMFRTKYVLDSPQIDLLSNYFVGELKKEALSDGQWSYRANALVYLTGDAAGSSAFDASLGKDIRKLGTVLIGAKQQVNLAPYAYTTYFNQYDTILASFNKESVTQLYGTIESNRWHLYAGARSYLISNYIYLDSNQAPAQASSTFNLTQVWLRKAFRWRHWILDNEIAWQQSTAGALVNVPTLMGRHQLSIEKQVFNSALRIATGIEARYHSTYNTPGYSPFFNRFYYQNSYQVTNAPELSAFFNFRIRKFRAYFMADQLQQLFDRNYISAEGYAAQNFMIRFGFIWNLVN